MKCMKDNAIESAIDSIIKTNGYRGTKAELYYFFHWLRKKHALRAYLTNLSSNRIPNVYFPEFTHSTVYKNLRKTMSLLSFYFLLHPTTTFYVAFTTVIHRRIIHKR